MRAHASKLGDDLQLTEHAPGELLPSLLAHFQKLFGVRGVQGVLPKMNELYLHSQEHATFTKVRVRVRVRVRVGFRVRVRARARVMVRVRVRVRVRLS